MMIRKHVILDQRASLNTTEKSNEFHLKFFYSPKNCIRFNWNVMLRSGSGTNVAQCVLVLFLMVSIPFFSPFYTLYHASIRLRAEQLTYLSLSVRAFSL